MCAGDARDHARPEICLQARGARRPGRTCRRDPHRLPAQLVAYPEPHLFADEPIASLGAVLAGAVAGRTSPEQITVFCSVGLAGTEVAIAAALSGSSET